MVTKYNNIDESIIEHELPNGLRVYLLPNNNVKNFYITLNVKFGSIDTEFKINNEKKYRKVPNGVAHFLEHLAFKMPDMDASSYFAMLGSSSNAYTSYDITCYEVLGYNLFNENLNYLLDFVFTPYFDNTIVNEEKGIIIEEAKMMLDRPEVKLAYQTYNSLFKNDLRKNMICGDIKDIKSIKLEDIKSCYETFYQPNNMFIIITGNFNPEEAIGVITENLNKKELINNKIIRKKVLEPVGVIKSNVNILGNVVIPKLNYALKIPLNVINKFSLTKEEKNIYISLLLNIKFGRSSILQDKLVSGNLVTDGLYISGMNTDNYYVIEISCETLYPSRVIELIDEELKNKRVSSMELIRKKRVSISNLIMAFDDIEESNCMIQSDIMNYNKIINNLYDIYENIDKKINLLSELEKILNTKNKTIVVLDNKK